MKRVTMNNVQSNAVAPKKCRPKSGPKVDAAIVAQSVGGLIHVITMMELGDNMTERLIDMQVKVRMDTNLATSLLDIESALTALDWPPDALEPFMEHIVNMLTYAWWCADYEAKQAQQAERIKAIGN